MESLRLGAFETNSSSMHAMALMSADAYEKFSAGLYYWDNNNDVIVTTQKMYDLYKKQQGETNVELTIAGHEDRVRDIMSVEQFVSCLEFLIENHPTSDETLLNNTNYVREFLNRNDFITVEDIERDYETDVSRGHFGGEEVVAFAYYGYCC